ncbi:MAG: lysoplasmalogenase family protein [Myxococcota bacterium]
MAPVTLCIVSVLGLLVAERKDHAWGRAVFKLSASSAFVWAGVSWGALDSGFGQWILAGLLLCWLGDAFLLASGQSLGFGLGIGAFLGGHLSYAVACTRLPLDAGALAVVGLALAVAATLTLRRMGPHLPREFRVPVVLYVVVISAMCALACAAAALGAPPLLGVGAIGFAVSDLSVARDRFIAESFWNGAWGLPAYFLSQLALASTVAAV